MTNILAGCGIALIYLNHFGESGVNGATFVDGNKIVLGLSVRGNYADSFWFSLFHELHHVIAGDVFCKEIDEECEINADLFARNQLIPVDKYLEFTKASEFTRENILEFADTNQIEKGIVVGREERIIEIQGQIQEKTRMKKLIEEKIMESTEDDNKTKRQMEEREAV